MPSALTRIFLSVTLLLLGISASCIRREPPPELSIHLYSGIRNFVSLGDSESQVMKTPHGYAREEIPEVPSTSTLRAVDVSHYFHFKDLGAKVYFRKGRVALIELQEPFRGEIQGKTLKVFEFQARDDKPWGEFLERELGPPLARGSGGRFGAEALFYGWGDISFNRMGPNELALYTDPAISQYRQRNFGREIRLFNR